LRGAARPRGARRRSRNAIAPNTRELAMFAAAHPLPSILREMDSTPHQPLRPSHAARASVSSDGLVLLDIDGGVVLSANEVGARIWQLIEQGRSSGEIARDIAETYAIPQDRADRDVTTFLADLTARGLITGVPQR
jgi:hypothetical protein